MNHTVECSAYSTTVLRMQLKWWVVFCSLAILFAMTDFSKEKHILSLPSAQAASTKPSGGIGLYLGEATDGSGRILVYTVTYKSPADKAKIKAGDELIAVDGKKVAKKSLAQIGTMIAGPPGTAVSLTLSRNHHPREVSLTRKALPPRASMSLPAPNQIGSGVYLNAAEKKLVKEKILGLKTEAKRAQMFELLSALKQKKISKRHFMKRLKQEFP